MNHRLTSYKDRRRGDLKLHTHVLWKGRRLGLCAISLDDAQAFFLLVLYSAVCESERTLIHLDILPKVAYLSATSVSYLK
jgi:hypothetical protein